jgi:hypothetical protein
MVNPPFTPSGQPPMPPLPDDATFPQALADLVRGLRTSAKRSLPRCVQCLKATGFVPARAWEELSEGIAAIEQCQPWPDSYEALAHLLVHIERHCAITSMKDYPAAQCGLRARVFLEEYPAAVAMAIALLEPDL